MADSEARRLTRPLTTIGCGIGRGAMVLVSSLRFNEIDSSLKKFFLRSMAADHAPHPKIWRPTMARRKRPFTASRHGFDSFGQCRSKLFSKGFGSTRWRHRWRGCAALAAFISQEQNHSPRFAALHATRTLQSANYFRADTTNDWLDAALADALKLG